jgi:hypothetical protein
MKTKLVIQNRTMQTFAGMLILMLLLSACAQVIPETGTQTNTINLEVSNTAVTVPESVQAGISSVVIQNTSQESLGVSLARLNTGVTVDQLTAQLAEDDLAAVRLVSLIGGSNTEAGQTQQITLDLKEGTYVVVVFTENEGAPLLENFQVVAASGAPSAAPVADVVVDMGDFNFTMPDSVQSGSLTWEIKNSGQQWHEFVIFKPQPGLTQEQFFEMVMSEQPPPEPMPFEESGFFGPISEGERGWMTLNLEPGTYWAVCFLPDIAGDFQSHVEKGMFKEFTVP